MELVERYLLGKELEKKAKELLEIKPELVEFLRENGGEFTNENGVKVYLGKPTPRIANASDLVERILPELKLRKKLTKMVIKEKEVGNEALVNPKLAEAIEYKTHQSILTK